MDLDGADADEQTDGRTEGLPSYAENYNNCSSRGGTDGPVALTLGDVAIDGPLFTESEPDSPFNSPFGFGDFSPEGTITTTLLLVVAVLAPHLHEEGVAVTVTTATIATTITATITTTTTTTTRHSDADSGAAVFSTTNNNRALARARAARLQRTNSKDSTTTVSTQSVRRANSELSSSGELEVRSPGGLIDFEGEVP